MRRMTRMDANNRRIKNRCSSCRFVPFAIIRVIRGQLLSGLQLPSWKAFLVDMRIFISLVTASVAFIVWITSGSAQDPAIALAKTVKVKFENDKVRVLEAELPAGVREAVHSHPAYVIYVIAGGKVRNYAADGTTSEAELKTGDVIYRDPLTHSAENIGTTTLHLVLVELKTASSR